MLALFTGSPFLSVTRPDRICWAPALAVIRIGSETSLKPDIIIWPETATPRSIGENYGIYRQVKQIAKKSGAPLLLGSSERQKYGEKDVANSSNRKYLNSAFLIRSKRVKEKDQRYDKIRLLPFGEYLPLKGTVPWSWINVPNIGNFMPGKEFTVFECPNFRFGVTICWENIFPELVRNFVKNGGQFIVNITNEARFGQTAAPYQFLSMSIMRAVENRVFVVRCANTGISCFIDPCGRVIDRVKDKNGHDIFVQGVLTGSIIPSSQKSFYTRYGNWLVWLSMIYSMTLLIISFSRKLQLFKSQRKK